MGESCGETVQPFRSKSQNTLFECMEQESPESSSGAQVEKRKQEHVTRMKLVHMIEQQEYRCKYSGIELTPETASLDHVVPVSKGHRTSFFFLQEG